MRAGLSRRFLIVGVLICGAFLLLKLVFISMKPVRNEHSEPTSKNGAEGVESETSAAQGSSEESGKASLSDAIVGKQPLKTRSSDRGATPDRSKLPTVERMDSPWEQGRGVFVGAGGVRDGLPGEPVRRWDGAFRAASPAFVRSGHWDSAEAVVAGPADGGGEEDAHWRETITGDREVAGIRLGEQFRP